MSDHPTTTIEIRPARPGDEEALARLAQLDSAPVPAGPLLLASERGELRAALSLATGVAIADPFAPTARLVAMLRAHAAPAERRSLRSAGVRLIRHGLGWRAPAAAR
jgi:hypothetical protein